MKEKYLSSSARCLLVVLVVVAVATLAAPVIAEVDPPDYPADKCVFMQPIPYDEPIDPYTWTQYIDLVKITAAQ